MSGERRYTESHEWVHLDGELGVIGISEFAVEQLGDVVYIDLPKIGKQLTAGDEFGEIESVKAVSQLYAPIGGAVEETNAELDATPELVNQSPLDAGWMIKLRLTSAADIDGLMTQDQYEAYLAEQA